MIARTEIEWDPICADISSGLDKNKNASMDLLRREYALNWLRHNHGGFLGEIGWSLREKGEKKGGFGRVYVLSNFDKPRCVVKMVSLVQLLDLGNSQSGDDKELLERGKSYFERKLQRLKDITNYQESRNLCKIHDFKFVPFVKRVSNNSSYKGMYSYVLADYIVCTKMEPLQEMNYIRDFCDGENVFDEQRLIEFAIKMCDSLMQLKEYYHRDLHPGNFMRSLDESREWKLIDYDSILEVGNNAPQSDYEYRVRCDGSLPDEMSYKSPDVKGRYDIYDDIYSAGCILYDIANYDYSTGRFRPRCYIGTHQELECDRVSEELLQIIRKACSKDFSKRYPSWKEFQIDLLGIRDTWRKSKHIRTIPGVCEEWACRNGSTFARMRVVDAEKSGLIKEYKDHYDIQKKVELYKIHFPVTIHFQSLIEEYEKDGCHYFIEKELPGVPLSDYIKLSCFDSNYYSFICQFLKSYIQMLSINVRTGVFKNKRLTSFRNLITSDNIFVSDSEASYFAA